MLQAVISPASKCDPGTRSYDMGACHARHAYERNSVRTTLVGGIGMNWLGRAVGIIAGMYILRFIFVPVALPVTPWLLPLAAGIFSWECFRILFRPNGIER